MTTPVSTYKLGLHRYKPLGHKHTHFLSAKNTPLSVIIIQETGHPLREELGREAETKLSRLEWPNIVKGLHNLTL